MFAAQEKQDFGLLLKYLFEKKVVGKRFFDSTSDLSNQSIDHLFVILV